MSYGEATFNLQVLDGRCFERAQKWANLIQNLSQNERKMEEQEEINFDELDNYFDAEDECAESSDSSMEATEEEETSLVRNEEKENIKRQLNQTIALLRAGNDLESRLHIENADNADNDEEMQDLLNLTVPVLMEHKRKFREEGLDDILTSFNPTAIEEAKCNWQRRYQISHQKHPPIKNTCQMGIFYSNNTFHRGNDCPSNCECQVSNNNDPRRGANMHKGALMRQLSYDMTPSRRIMDPGLYTIPQHFPPMQAPYYHGMYNDNPWPNELSQYYNGCYQNSFSKMHYNMLDRPMTPHMCSPLPATQINSMALMHSAQRGLVECRGNSYRHRADTDSMLFLNRRNSTRTFESLIQSRSDLKSQINVMETTLSCISIKKTTSRQLQECSNNDHAGEENSENVYIQKGRQKEKKARTQTRNKPTTIQKENKQLKNHKQLPDTEKEIQEIGDNFDHDLKLAIANSVKTYKKEQNVELTDRKKGKKPKKQNVLFKSPKAPMTRSKYASAIPKTMLEATKVPKSPTTTLKSLEDTFLNISKPICNSTVITNDIAKDEEICILSNVSATSEKYASNLEHLKQSQAHKIARIKDVDGMQTQMNTNLQVSLDEFTTAIKDKKDGNRLNASAVSDVLPKEQSKAVIKQVQKEQSKAVIKQVQQKQQHQQPHQQPQSTFALSSDQSLTNADVTVIEKDKSITNEIKTDNNCELPNSPDEQHGITKDILVYKPSDGSLSPETKTIRITEEILSKAIGKEASRKFFKFYVGFREFNAKCNIYYRPPECRSENDSSDDDSDADIFEVIESCGKLYAVYE